MNELYWPEMLWIENIVQTTQFVSDKYIRDYEELGFSSQKHYLKTSLSFTS